ncbi:MAG TPA: hypothetical protein VIN77_09675 [Aurantimonas sp.]|uniref:DUF937 domain-containing protein n=1 Tax=Aurantimonas marianensis TaxID=2920428 RepID=A0A9X2KDP0_9HYPH|nr:hypothetical protein [Aurantimonas marianensis]MCP3053814.1 hypothetical protein [Aurantimonas marianensis]
MTDFFDWLTVGDSGLGADRLADAFKLSHQEVRQTTEALAPAFTLALQRAMLDPVAWTELSHRFLPFMDGTTMPGAETARSPAAKDLADALFGSRDISNAVARKVSLASGIAPDTVEKLMRNLSIMTMQTMVRMMLANVARNQPAGLADGNYPVAIAEMMRRGANAMEAMGRPSDTPRRRQPDFPGAAGSDYLAGLFADALNGKLPFMPPVSGAAERPSAPSRRADDDVPATSGFTPFQPFEAMMEGFARGLQSGGEPAPGERENAAPEPTPDAAPSNAFDDLARAGQKMQDDYARQMTELFQRFQNGTGSDKGR